MLATLLLAAALACQSPPSGTLRPPQAAMIYFPGYSAADLAYFREYGMPALGPFANKGHERHAFAFYNMALDAPAGWYLVNVGRPWYFSPPAGWGIR